MSLLAHKKHCSFSGKYYFNTMSFFHAEKIKNTPFSVIQMTKIRFHCFEGHLFEKVYLATEK